MNILPSFSPYPSSSLPLTKTGKKGTARDNEQKKSKIMVAEREARAAKLALAGCAPALPACDTYIVFTSADLLYVVVDDLSP